MRRQVVRTFFVLGLIALTPRTHAEDMQVDGFPPAWEIRSDQVAALEMAVAEIRRQLPTFPIDEFDIVLLNKEHEFVFIFLHESIRLQGLHFRGCGLPDNPTWEVGVSKDAARITHSICPK